VAQIAREKPVPYAPHAALAAKLVGKLRAGTLAHGTLWLGADGIGKFLWANTLARQALCLLQADDACVCASCASLADHPDFILLEEGALKIENVREVIGRASLKPLVSPHRVVIVRDAHLLTTGAQNALLKTLEEPSGQTLFFLITHRERTLLPTIRSRCQKLRFAPFDAAGFTQHFPALATTAGASGGSVAEAKRIQASEVKPLSALLRASFSERIAAAEALSESQETTLAAARRYADQLAQWTRSGTPEQRARAQTLFGDLGELLRRSEGHVNRRLLWERWLLSPAPRDR
jgi:DNA polymerase-3 subunit delta'